jgi:hypothetical protein
MPNLSHELILQLNALVSNGQIGAGDFRRYLVMCTRPAWSKAELAEAVNQTIRAIEASLRTLCNAGLVVKVQDDKWVPKNSSPMIDRDRSLSINQSDQHPKGEEKCVSHSEYALANKVREILDVPVSLSALNRLIREETAEVTLKEEHILSVARRVADRHKLGEVRKPIAYFRISLRTEIENLQAAKELTMRSAARQSSASPIVRSTVSRKPQCAPSVLFEKACEFIRSRISREHYKTWFSHLRALEHGDKLVIQCDNPFTKDWIEVKYLKLLEYALAKVGGGGIALELAC